MRIWRFKWDDERNWSGQCGQCLSLEWKRDNLHCWPLLKLVLNSKLPNIFVGFYMHLKRRRVHKWFPTPLALEILFSDLLFNDKCSENRIFSKLGMQAHSHLRGFGCVAPILICCWRNYRTRCTAAAACLRGGLYAHSAIPRHQREWHKWDIWVDSFSKRWENVVS